MPDLYPPWDSTRVAPGPEGLPDAVAILSRIEADFQRPAILGPVPCQSCLHPVVLVEVRGLWLNAERRTVHAPPCACAECDCSYPVCDPDGLGVVPCLPCEMGDHLAQ